MSLDIRSTHNQSGSPDSRRASLTFTFEPSPEGQKDLLADSRRWLLDRQAADGSWCGYLEGDSILESEYLLLQVFLGREQTDICRRLARGLAAQQQEHGGWSQYPGGDLEVSASVKAYWALKLMGYDPESAPMKKARDAIRRAGGADAVNSFTRFYLALLGQLDYKYCPAVPPEAIFLPAWFPINIYRISAWSRTMLIPLALVWAFRPTKELPEHLRIDELFIQPPEKWKPLRAPGLPDAQQFFSWEKFFYGCDRWLKRLEAYRIRPLRKLAIHRCQKWMLDRFVDSDGLGAIFPPIVWSRIVLKALGYAEDSTEVRYCDEQLEMLIRPDEVGDQLRLEPCKSPVWDTAISLRGLAAAGYTVKNAEVERAIDWLLSKQVTQPGDWQVNVKAEPAGWYFEYHNEFYPDTDDTSMVLIALRDFLGDEVLQARGPKATVSLAKKHVQRWADIHSAAERSLAWLIAMQNADGGWGAFDKNNNAEFLCYVPFADHNAMIDPSTPDITARIVESLAAWGYGREHSVIQRAIEYVRKHQEADGSWYGRWGVNYIYGTWQVLVGLKAAGVESTDPMLQRGAEWLLSKQQSDGGWGESPRSYEDPEWHGRGPVTASQTAWALLGLMAVLPMEHAAIQRGLQWLLNHRNAAGTWDESEMTGTGFPRVFYLRYWMYSHYFPMMAIGKYQQWCEQREEM
ncbi:MAG: squalene--hopene cyclase [Planctomycetes bacterium]|nr:squalene--hopene cyclase [Planctomycetota bacterium]